MYQSSAATPSGSRSSTPAEAAAPAVVTRSTPSAPSPRRRSQSAATRDSVRRSAACGSGSTTKSFWVPWPFANFTCSGYVAPRPRRAVDEAGTIGGVEPVHPVVTAKPRPLPSHIASGAHEGLLARLAQSIRSAARIERRDHLRVAQGAGGGDPVAQTPLEQRGDLADQTLVEHRVGTPGEPFIENRCVTIQPDDDGVPPRCADLWCRGAERLAGQLHHFQGPHRAPGVGGQD